jgi:predicted nucleic-acid-binding Zn-ribbon protein
MDKKELKCPLCESIDFDVDKVVLAKYGVFRISDYKVKMLTCKQCKYIMLFEAGNTFFLGVD